MLTLWFGVAIAAAAGPYLPADAADGRTTCLDPSAAVAIGDGSASFEDAAVRAAFAGDVDWLRARLGEALARDRASADTSSRADAAMAQWAAGVRDPSQDWRTLPALASTAKVAVGAALGVSPLGFEVPRAYVGKVKGSPADCALPDGVRRVDPSMSPWEAQRLPQLGADGKTTRVWAIPLSSPSDEVTLTCKGRPGPLVLQPQRDDWPEGPWSWERVGDVGVLQLMGAAYPEDWPALAALPAAAAEHRGAAKLVVDLRGTQGGSQHSVYGHAWLEALLGHAVPIAEGSSCAAWNTDVRMAWRDETGDRLAAVAASAPGRLTAAKDQDESNAWSGEIVVLVDGQTTSAGERLAVAIRSAAPDARVVGGIPAGLSRLPTETQLVMPGTGVGLSWPMSLPSAGDIEVDLLLSPELLRKPPAELVDLLF